MAEQNKQPFLFLSRADLTLVYHGKPLNLRKPLGRVMNRYYVPLLEITKYIGGRIRIEQQKIYLYQSNHAPVIVNNEINNYILNEVYSDVYISLFDFCCLFHLKTKWDYTSKRIMFYPDGDHTQHPAPNSRIAFIRLEDVTAGGWYLDSANLEKFQIVGDYMYGLSIPFHIAWISRYIDPPNNIDNDVSRDYNMPNAHFVFTFDYLLKKGGLIGLHGYTHQDGNEVSGDGTEFTETLNTDEASIRQRVEAAIDIANRLGYPYKFFESPHYTSTAYQQSIFEQYFDIIYEGYVGIWGDQIVKSPRNNRTLYIPTPLGFVEGENGIEKMEERIRNLSDDALASLFYHPYAEFEFIELKEDLTYTYSENSPLHRIVRAIRQKGCKFSKITDIDSSMIANT